jgi:hypothetical protein
MIKAKNKECLAEWGPAVVYNPAVHSFLSMQVLMKGARGGTLWALSKV